MASPDEHHLHGDLTTFLDALGTPGGLFALIEVLGLIGPTYETVDVEDPGSEIIAFPHTGAMLFFRDTVLSGVLIHLRQNGHQAPYPEPAALVRGLGPTSGRDAVRALLGEPRQASRLMDLFMVGSSYVRFDYDDDGWASVTLLLAGQDPL